jgi:flagellar protein FliJ
MRRFQFTLATLLEIRKRKEDECKREMGEKNRKIMQAKKEMLGLHGALASLQAEEKKRRSTHPDLQSMRHAVAFRNQLKLDMLAKGEEIRVLEEDAEVVRKKLTRLTQEKRAVEIIGERRLAEWKKEANRQEQGTTDDVSQQGFIRKKRAAAAIAG